MGNYWSDYTGTDGNGDGLGDSSYRVDSDNDEQPLMVPRENYLTTLFWT
jgi:nitrous oxidase accessory protein NosD